MAREDKQGDKRLVSYVVSNGDFNKEGMILWLKAKLPAYMVPSIWVELEVMPLSLNGKIDKRALPDVDVNEQLKNEYAAPQNETQQKLTGLWKNLLGAKKVGIHDNFFELGGHSLLAVRLVSSIRKAFEVEMPISDIFEYPTVAFLAAQIEVQSGTNILPSIEVIQPRPEHIPLSFSQERLWFIDKLEGSVQYHVPAVLSLKGRLNIKALELALQTIVNRHEVLRTVFVEDDGHVYQEIKATDQWHLNVTDGLLYAEDNTQLKRYIKQLINRPFDLSKDDMVRGDLIRLKDEEYVLIVTLHHIASDGWSRSVLVKEVAELYDAHDQKRLIKLDALPVQYADFALWQHKYLEGEVLNSKLQYWKDKLRDVEPLQLPTDYTRPAIQSSNGAVASFRINEDVSSALNLLGHQQGATLFMTLLAIFKILLYRYTGQQDICIGTPVAGRQHQELEGLIGFFLNTLVLRTNVDSQFLFTELLQQVRTTTLEAYGHQEVPFEKVVESVVKERDQSRTPLFQVMFILQNTPEIQQLKLGELQLSTGAFDHHTAKYEITLFITESAGELRGSIEYNTDLFSKETIEGMITHFKQLVASVIQSPGQTLAAMPMLTSAETHQLLTEFNNTDTVFPKDKTVVHLFEEQVLKTT